MVSRRNYLTITIVMFILFVLFQFTNVVLESWKGFEKNPYARTREELSTRSTAYEAGKEKNTEAGVSLNKSVVYIGDEKEAAGKTVYNWAVYTKRQFLSAGTVAEYASAGAQLPEFLVIDGENAGWEQTNDCAYLEDIAKKGVALIFCSLPKPSVIEEQPELKELLGIKEIKEMETSVAGLHLKEGFLLGGETVYRTEDKEEAAKRQDMELTFPWYTLDSGAEAYMEGIPKEKTEEKDYPAVVWENRFQEACVFAVNGGYMEDAAGIGLLSAMSYKADGYELYPIVNAQNMVIVNYPSLAPENEEEMQERYGQSMQDVLWNIVWPSVISVYRKNTLGLSCMMTPQYDYEEDGFPSQASLEFYMKRLKEQSAETGLSGESVSETPIGQKLQDDADFMQKSLPSYKFTSFYTGGLTDLEVQSALQEKLLESVRSIVSDYDTDSEVIGYYSDSITKQSTLSDGTRHTYMEDFRVRSVETALGYTSVKMDISRGAYPETKEDGIEDITSDFGWNIRYYWKNFQAFSGTGVSECDQRIRNFLAADYTQSKENGKVSLDFTSMETPAWFILRTENEAVTHMDGGEFQMIEEGAYLIEATDNHVAIELVPEKE